MHAVSIQVMFADRTVAVAELDEIVLRVSGMPGFVAGYWVAVSGDKGKAMIVFDSEEAAQALANVLQSAPARGGVAAESIEVGEVMAHA